MQILFYRLLGIKKADSVNVNLLLSAFLVDSDIYRFTFLISLSTAEVISFSVSSNFTKALQIIAPLENLHAASNVS